jgi:hypothetical protein
MSDNIQFSHFARVSALAKTLEFYCSYLLRLRCVDNGGHPVWRLSLQKPGHQEHVAFSSLEELVVFLRAQMPNERGLADGWAGKEHDKEEP